MMGDSVPDIAGYPIWSGGAPSKQAFIDIDLMGSQILTCVGAAGPHGLQRNLPSQSLVHD